jgi:hypothetical protein
MERSAIRGMPAQQRRAPRRGAVNTLRDGFYKRGCQVKTFLLIHRGKDFF